MKTDRQKTRHMKIPRKDIKLIKDKRTRIINIKFLLNFLIFIYNVPEHIFLLATKKEFEFLRKSQIFLCLFFAT